MNQPLISKHHSALFNLRGLATASVLALCASAGAQAPAELKFATSAPPNTVWQKQLERFAADVASETGGSVKISVFYGSQLGAENDAIAQLARGRIDMGLFTLSSVSLQVPEANLAGMPMFYDNVPQRECVLDKHMVEPTRALLAKKNIHFVGWMETGMAQIAGKRSFVTPADIKGQKVGITVNKVLQEFWEAQGAVPVATPVPEAAANLGTGLIAAYSVGSVGYVALGINKVAPVLSLISFHMAPAVMLMSKATQDKLTPEQRAGVARAMAKVPASQIRAEVAEVERFLIGRHKEGGGSVVEPTAAQAAEWRKPMAAYYTNTAKEMGKDAEALLAKLQEAKKACGN